MNARTAPVTATEAIPTTAATLIAYQRAHRDGPPPAGSILDPAILAENLQALLEQHIGLLEERQPEQRRRYNLDRGEWVNDGPPPPPFDPRRDPTASALALLISFVQDRAAK